MKVRLRKRRQSMVIPAKYKYKHKRIYATGGRLEMKTLSGSWLDMGVVAVDALLSIRLPSEEMARSLEQFTRDIGVINEQLRRMVDAEE